jgi:hypothetical protein
MKTFISVMKEALLGLWFFISNLLRLTIFVIIVIAIVKVINYILFSL